MRNYIVACSLIATAIAAPNQGFSTEAAQEDFRAYLKGRMASFNADPDIVKALFSDGAILEQGEDAALRPRYVSAQAIFEQILAQELSMGKLKKVVAVIHTPLPATPLCTDGEVTPDLVDPAILKDEKRLQTVRERPAILRALLQSGGTLMAAYPSVARVKRSSAQLCVFDSLLAKYPEVLLDVPMACLEVAPEMVGASYLFQTAQGEWMTYSVRFTQAISPKDPTHAGMWFGSIEKGPAADRLAQVSAYLQACQGPNLIGYAQ